MKSKLKKQIYESDCLVFIDFEAASPSHTIIAVGMDILPKKENSFEFYPENETVYGRLIQNENEISEGVSLLTGLTKEKLEKEGVSFSDCIREMKDFLRPYHNKRFYSYGKNDLLYLKNSVSEKSEEQDFFACVRNHYLDLQVYFSHYLTNEKGNVLSLSSLAEIYSVKPKYPFHDPRGDSQVLKDILLSFYQKKDITMDRFLSYYERLSKNPELDKRIASSFLKGMTKEEVIKEIEDSL